MAKAPKLPPDFKLLGEDKKAELRRKAKAAIEAEQAKSSEDAYYEQLLAAERRAVVPSERLETYTIDLAPFTDRVVIDGTAYWHGQTVTVAPSINSSSAIGRPTMFDWPITTASSPRTGIWVAASSLTMP